MSESFISDLICSECGRSHPASEIQTVCAECRAPLLTRYDLEHARRTLDRDAFATRPRGMWRWAELLPVLHQKNRISLGEGDAPLLRVPRLSDALGLPHLTIKDESRNPTLTFKARGVSAAISKAVELGIKKVIIPTAGNAGGATAAYAARARLRARVIMPEDSPPANIHECRISGAEVVLVNGLISDAARLASEQAAREGWFDLSTFKEPYRVEGKKVMGYELAESSGWRLPDVIIYPTGGGTGLVGMWKAFTELAELGWLEAPQRPRFAAVQAEGCAPVVKALHSGAQACEVWPEAHTVASGLRVPRSYADRKMLRDLRESHGTAVAVSDDSILQAQRELAALEGVYAAPEGAATLAALRQLIRIGWLRGNERIVLFNTGSGLKYDAPQ